MKSFILFLLLASLFFISSCEKEVSKFSVEKKTDANGYDYKTVAGDPAHVRIYTLDNGLKVYLRDNNDAPRIQTFIAVKAGSTYDPSETTGLAHYLEHMMFKGTSKIATKNWDNEKGYIQEISDLFEEHKAAKDPETKDKIYLKIDSVSQIAAGYAIANEYDKLVSSLGAKGTNAYTSDERTVYVNDIPSNELEKWLMLEKERFSKLVLRLFHTELEAVYEEFNMGQDNDYFKVWRKIRMGLFKNHPYGTQTTIGKPEHLKNPSMVNIQNYWKTYYVPNNMAICLSGDLDPDKTIKLINKYFGSFEPNKNIPKFVPPVEEPITKPEVYNVKGPEAEFLNLAFRFGGIHSEDRKYVTLIDMILNNTHAGLIDLNLVQKQKVLRAGCYPEFLKDYGIHEFYGNPREGQTLEEVKDLILGQIELVKKGEFDDWLIPAIINDLRLQRIKEFESNYLAHSFVTTFAMDEKWPDYLKFIDELGKISKKDIVEFAKKHYKDNYVVVYKRVGEDKDVVKVEKPPITPVKINRDDQSDFYKKFINIKTESIKPVFVNFSKKILTSKLNSGVQFDYIKNTSNELFSIYYIIDMGKKNNLILPTAVNYLKYIGTDKYSPEDLKKEFYKYGLSYGVYAGDDRCYVFISGLDKSFEKGVEMMEQILSSAKADDKIYADYADGILKKRKDSKKNKNVILWNGLYNYAKYGPRSLFTYNIKNDELSSIDPEKLTDAVNSITSFKHKIFYYGPESPDKIKPVLDKYHKVPEKLKDYPEPAEFPELATDENKVFFVDYDMVQANILMLSKDQLFDKTLIPESRIFGEFYGSGLSSIIFQEIRESKALAYSAFSAYATPARYDESYWVYGFVATQADKLKNSTDAMIELMNNMPKADKQFEQAKESIIKKIQTERIIKTNIYFQYLNNMDKKINYDYRKDVYETAQTLTLDEFGRFFNKHIAGKKYNFLIIANKNNIDMNVLKKLGTLKELTLEEIFNY